VTSRTREILSTLPANETDVNTKTFTGKTALHLAVREGHVQVARLLLENGADFNARPADDELGVLEAASSFGQIEIVQLLSKKGADVNETRGYYGGPLCGAVLFDKERIVRLLLDNGAAVNVKGGRWGNPLQTAAFRGRETIVQWLLENGAEVNACGTQKRKITALRLALQGNYEAIARLLREYGGVEYLPEANRETNVNSG